MRHLLLEALSARIRSRAHLVALPALLAGCGHGAEPTRPAEPTPRAKVVRALPAQASRSLELRDPVSGLSAAVRLLGARPVPPVAADGGLRFARAVLAPGLAREGADLFLRERPDGVEDFVDLGDARAATLSYELSLGASVAGLRHVGHTVELLDVRGAPRLRMAPPYVTAGDGDRQSVSVSVSGCAVDVDPRAPWGRPTTDPVSRICRLVLDWTRLPGDSRPAILDPAWTTTGSLIEGRAGHTTTTLLDGRLLVAGGLGHGQSPQMSAELFDPQTSTFAATGAMIAPRGLHAAASLDDGRVLVAGGTDADQQTTFASAELYDPATGVFSATSAMSVARYSFSATTLPGKGEVLITGGETKGTDIPAPELFQVATSTFGPTAAPLFDHRFPSSATWLSGAKVLVVGDSGGATVGGRAEIYDGATGSWTDAGTLSPRSDLTATRLADGRVLFSGTCGTMGCMENMPVQVFFPAETKFKNTDDIPPLALFRHQAALLGPDTVLLSGGIGYFTGAPTANVGSFEGVTYKVTSVSPMSAPRWEHTLTSLPGGRAIAIGGSSDTSSKSLADVEIYGPEPLGSACGGPADCQSGLCEKGACCATACSGLCNSCVGAKTGGVDGTCAPVLAGTDPDDECPDVGSPTCNPHVSCDGAGACQKQSPLSCQGDTCTKDSECSSGFCTDGVCCDQRCDGICMECGGEMPGMCAPVPANISGNADCPSDPVGTVCGAPGACDGQGACQLFVPNDSCGDRRCDGETPIDKRCSAPGICSDTPLASCGGYHCDPRPGAGCTSNCFHDSDCAPNYICKAAPGSSIEEPAGVCVGGQAATCISEHEVQDVDGTRRDCGLRVCREGACAGQCYSSQDCAAGSRCSAHGLCEVPEADDSSVLDKCHCETPGRSQGGGGGRMLAAAALALLFVARRRTR